jgi:TetR/AcrR family transcriptional regulator, transcriptional repressor for nem operon
MTTIMSAAPSRKEISHDRIVEAASRAIRRAGYQGVGVADIMKEAGLTHGGFYAHFESRDALLVEAVQRAGRDNAAVLGARIAQRRADGESPLAALVNAYLHDQQLASTEHGCVVAALASEMPRQGDALLDASRTRVLGLVDAVRRALPDGADEEDAAVIAATLVGALQLARTLGGKAGRSLLARTRQTLVSRHAPQARA